MTIVAVKKKLLNIILQTKMFCKKRQEIGTEICQKKKKKQKVNIAEIDTRKLKKNWEVNYKNELLLV